MRSTLIIALLACACGGSSTTNTPQDLPHPETSSAKTYPIHMARAFHVGQKLHLTSDAEEARTTTMTREGSIIEKKAALSRVHFDAMVTIESLDAKQDALHATYEVADLSASGDKPRTLMHAQKLDVTRAKNDDDAIVLVDGAPATAEMREALKMVLTFRTGGPSDDEIFGSKEPREVGAHWTIDAQRAHDDLVADQGSAMAGATLDGDVTLASLAQTQGHDCLELKSELHMANISVPQAPPGSKVIEGKATATFEGMFPLDEKLPRLSDKLKLAMTIQLAVQSPSGEVIVKVGVVNKRDRMTTPL